MTEYNVKKAFKKYEKQVPKVDGVENFKRRLTEAPESAYEAVMGAKIKNVWVTVVLSVFLGMFGVDRFYSKDLEMGIAKATGTLVALIVYLVSFLLGFPSIGLVALVGIALWCIVDIFLAYKETKRYNYDVLNEILHNAIGEQILANEIKAEIEEEKENEGAELAAK